MPNMTISLILFLLSVCTPKLNYMGDTSPPKNIK